MDTSNSFEIASYAFSILSICFYSVVYYPQFYEIYKTKRADGISVWMLLVWSQADFISLVGTIVLQLEVSLLIVGWYHVFIGLCMTLYTLYYTSSGNSSSKTIKLGIVTVYYLINLSVCIYLNASWIYNYEAGIAFGWLASVLYIIGRLPQLYLNFKRKSTEGLSVLMYWLTIAGNTSYLISVLVYSIEPEYINLNMPWIIMVVVTVLMDIVVILQAFYYKKRVVLQSNENRI